jgi:hypothetical protein
LTLLSDCRINVDLLLGRFYLGGLLCTPVFESLIRILYSSFLATMPILEMFLVLTAAP